MEHLLDWFTEISELRSGNGSGPNSISWEAILAWSKLWEIRLSPWEIKALVKMNNVWIDHVYKRHRSSVERATATSAAPPMTPGIFMALFGPKDSEGGVGEVGANSL